MRISKLLYLLIKTDDVEYFNIYDSFITDSDISKKNKNKLNHNNIASGHFFKKIMKWNAKKIFKKLNIANKIPVKFIRQWYHIKNIITLYGRLELLDILDKCIEKGYYKLHNKIGEYLEHKFILTVL